ncbi:MAG: energy-coupling factor ABC transporter permease [Sphaerochaeta sp.]
MHMADVLISTPVGLSMMGCAAVALGYSIKQVEKEDNEGKSVKMGVLGAMIFASQMVNFTIPGTGASGHIVGTVLLAALLGPFASFITIASILLVQAFIFADGGLLAYGCNVINMGFFGAFIAYPLIMKPILKRSMNKKTIMIASIATSIIALQLGAAGVVFETSVSSISSYSLSTFLLLMLPIHLAIGLIEGIITGFVLQYLYSVRPSLIAINSKEEVVLSRSNVTAISLIALFIASVLSLFASSNPDGLEWSVARANLGGNVTKLSGFLSQLQSKISIFQGYSLNGSDASSATVISGISGVVIVSLMIIFLSKIGKKKQKS